MLLDDDYSAEEAVKEVPNKVKQLLEANFKARLEEAKRPPSDFVRLDGEASISAML